MERLNQSSQQKISYRPFRASDLELRVKWLKNPSVKQNMGWQIREGVDLDDQKKWFKKYQKDKYDKRFIIEADNKPVGMVGLTEIDPLDKNADLYIMIGEDEYRGRGIGRQACEYIIDLCFKKLKLHKLNLTVHGHNTRAINLYHSLRFVDEGHIRDQIFFNGRYHDEIHMGLINK